MASVNGKRTEGSIKELIDSLQDPLALNKLPFVSEHCGGSPSRIEGLGSSIEGVKGKSSPCSVTASRSCFLPCVAWLGSSREAPGKAHGYCCDSDNIRVCSNIDMFFSLTV